MDTTETGKDGTQTILTVGEIFPLGEVFEQVSQAAAAVLHTPGVLVIQLCTS